MIYWAKETLFLLSSYNSSTSLNSIQYKVRSAFGFNLEAAFSSANDTVTGTFSIMYPRDVGDNNEASFQFYIGLHYNGKRREDCKLKKCGVRLMYAQDHGEFDGSFSSVKEEDENRPQPKRLKLMEFH
ncbi:hypothetical protein Q3G72_023579 [Acer saccharum]|nr:hypothetical protein Q3G72_023579 [Acer saccharum]